MLKKFSKKSVLLLGAVMALCAFAMPSMASAASWTGAGDISANGLGFTATALNSGSFCRSVTFPTLRHNAAVLTITSASFTNCHGTVGPSTGCTVTATGKNFPWRATAVTTTDIRIHDVAIDVRFETTPPAGSVACANNGTTVTLTGTLGLGIGTQTVWDAVAKRVTFTNTTGLAAHIDGVVNNIGTVVNGSAIANGTLNIAD